MTKSTNRRATIVMLMALTLWEAVGSAHRHDNPADPNDFVFAPIAFLGDSAPGGGAFLDVFESNFINNRGEVLFGTNLTAIPEQGLFLLRKPGKRISVIARVGEPAPGGGEFGLGFLSPNAFNDKGDAGFSFLLNPFSFPVGMNAGVYRFSHAANRLTAIVMPGATATPDGETFAGATFGTSLNNRGVLAFGGIVPTDSGVHLLDEPYAGLGAALYSADKKGHISAIVRPGDQAPGGGMFDFTMFPRINASNDIAFMGHVAGDECRAANFPPQAILMICLTGVYVKDGATETVWSIAHAGDPAPGGGVYRQAISPVLNDRGDIVFLGDLTSPPLARQVNGVYLYSNGVTIPVARPGFPMPGGGRFVSASNIPGWQISVNNPGDVAFNAVLNTDDNGDGVPDTGLFVWSHGLLRVVARTGMVIPGVGEVAHLVMGVPVVLPAGFVPNSGAAMNDRGQVVFGATLTDGRGVLLVATPISHAND
jgi:hypothetical protein